MHIAMVVYSDLNYDFRVYREAEALAEAGHRLSLVAPDFGRPVDPVWDRFELIRPASDPNQSLRLRYPLFWSRARRALTSINADAIHAHDLDTLWPATRAAAHRSIPVVYDSHEYFTEQSGLVGRPLMQGFWWRLERRLIRRVHRTIAVSDSIARALRDRYRLPDVLTLRNLPPYRPVLESQRIRQVLGLDLETRVVLYQGGFLTDNGLREQIQAMADVAGAVFVLVGDGPCEEALKSQVLRAGLDQRVRFIPRVPFAQLHEYTCAADLGLCLIKGSGKSFFHSMPNKLFEYMMAGIPVLASDFPEMRAVVTETGAGRVAVPDDVSAIGRTIGEMLADTTALSRYASAARAAAKRYCWERESTRLIQLYEEL